MRLFIPALGTKLKLTAPWRCSIMATSNEDVLLALGAPSRPDYQQIWDATERRYVCTNVLRSDIRVLDMDRDERFDAEFADGTILAVDRIYIRKGAAEFDSITFRVFESPIKALLPRSRGGTMANRQARFWVSLADANTIEADVVG